MSLTPGLRLSSRYEILVSLGAGGMGEVYKARDLRLGRDVAVKVLPEHLAKDSSALSRFEREGKAVAALSHPNILAIHDFGTDNGVSFAVMELLEGETLRDRIKSSPMPWRSAVEVALAIAEGLSAAHSKGVIHRDLKPENIFLTTDGQVKILDFGLAHWKAERLEQELSSTPTESHISQTGSVMGTVPYMSPEQVRGTTIDVRSDIFAFGSVLCEMLTGTRAFARTTAADTMAAILKEEPNEIDQLRAKIPVELQRVISHCLERNPEQRFQTARDLAYDLKATLSGSEMVRPLVSKSQIRPVVWTAAILLLLVLIAFLYTFTIRNQPIASVAILPFVNETKDPNNELLIDGITENLINNLSQLPNLRVMARDTVFHYKNQAKDLRKIGRDLKVEAVVTGRVSQQGDSLVVSTGLVRVADGSQLWGEKYNRKLSDVVKIETDLSKEIAENLRLRLTGDQKRLLEKRPTENAESYRLYLKGRYHWFKSTEEDFEKSREYFQEAIDIDPVYSLAHAWLGNYFLAMGFEGYRPPKEVMPKAEAAHKKALEIDPDLGMGYLGLGNVKFLYEWKWREAEEDFQRWLALDPSFGRRAYSQLLLASGRTDEAIQEVKAALDSDPLSRVYSVNIGQYLMVAGRYNEAIQQLLQTIDMDPNYDAAHFSLANALERKEMYEEAAAEWKKGYLAQKNAEAAALFDDVQGKSNYFEVMRTIAEENVAFLIELSQERYVSPVSIAKYYAQLDQKDEAFRWLEKAFEERSTQLVFLKVDHNWDNLRSDARFADLAKRIGLP